MKVLLGIYLCLHVVISFTMNVSDTLLSYVRKYDILFTAYCSDVDLKTPRDGYYQKLQQRAKSDENKSFTIPRNRWQNNLIHMTGGGNKNMGRVHKVM